jgi:hypothetical protein
MHVDEADGYAYLSQPDDDEVAGGSGHDHGSGSRSEPAMARELPGWCAASRSILRPLCFVSSCAKSC